MSKRTVALNERGNVRIGEDHPRAQLTDHEVRLVLAMRESGMRYEDIAAAMEVSKSTVAMICRGERRCQVAVRWKVVAA